VIFDTLEEDAISQKMATIIPEFSKTAKNELLIVNAYLIPNEDMMNAARELIQKEVKIKVVTIRWPPRMYRPSIAITVPGASHF
jgi:phosphatidylserine/phosphatidylglycerophosphate/cardiolipin synthase-like enzyme